MHTLAITFILSAIDPVQVQKRNTVPDTNQNDKTPIYAGLCRRAVAGLDNLSKIIRALYHDHVHLQASHPLDESYGADSTAAIL